MFKAVKSPKTWLAGGGQEGEAAEWTTGAESYAAVPCEGT